MKHAKASGRRRRPSERSRQGPERRARRQNGTQPRAAPAATRPDTDSLFTPSQLATWEEAGSRNGKMSQQEGWNLALLGCLALQLLTLEGSEGRFPKKREKTTPQTSKASSPCPPATRAPGPLTLKRACANLGFIRLNSVWFPGLPPPPNQIGGRQIPGMQPASWPPFCTWRRS